MDNPLIMTSRPASGFFKLLMFLSIAASPCLHHQTLAAVKPHLEVIGGFDGANPQAQDLIIMETPNRFRIKPFNEEGSNDSYYFRFNTKVINHSTKSQSIELIVEWPVLKERPNYPYDTYYYGDIGNWQWTYANIDGMVAKLHITVPPGTTYVGCYPRYSYEYFDDFMNGLAEDKDLTKWIEGKSFYDRNIWCVKITEADVPDENKNTILLTARNHPYETSGSYITEEIITFLQSGKPEAKRLKKENIIYIMPMLNPDGVALGMNQRTRPNGVNISYGVGTDDPAVTTLLNIVDKIRPGIWADIHGWPQEGVDGMWSTHKWVTDGLLSELPDGTFNDYQWRPSFVKERNVSENHLWQWLLRQYDSGGVSLSISWYRRSEEDMRKIAVRLIQAIGVVMSGSENSNVRSSGKRTERVQPFPGNPFYLAWGDTPVFPLGPTGYHAWTPISRPGTVDSHEQLYRLSRVIDGIGSPHVVGFVRCLPYDPNNHMHDGEVVRVLQPWVRMEDGRYDLRRFEPEWVH
jgi:hypothetical protein